MALTDIHFQEGEGQDFILEVPSATYTGVLSDITVEPGGSQFPMMEITAGKIYILQD